ncbi:translation initiation factor eIF4e [Cutaneotrichosporon oleaginosum]|uniref:Translation initiation factor eIF4e n=1 Tax=Cutaneotrichosporon oleaginosum TaxID=879819 RepID=A0A0J0XZQ6_9TREE|nr:translation initiation factor eIF4e [Cutaneotrichosporon oleaginosum]KLT46518.1 translation initiation factor eIF4e [Cutaneotrichosporon oleaginosum]TXT15115.1 hypothetical protein COLE_01308 [Cutaneotrichosporon oleaginosum]
MGDIRKSSNRMASRRGVRPPSLKDISDRLTTSTPVALNEITTSTNLPAAQSRLKLPASAAARANLAPTASPIARVGAHETHENENIELSKVGKEGSEDKAEVHTKALSNRSSTDTLKNSESSHAPSKRVNSNSLALSIGESVDSPTPSRGGSLLMKEIVACESPTETQTTKAEAAGSLKPKTLAELRHKSRASLGHGFPETPPRSKEDVPSIVVQRSTPGESTSKAAGSSGSTSSSPMPGSPRSIANGLPLEHSWSIWYDSRTYKPPPDVLEERCQRMTEWEASMMPVGSFDTIQSFWRLMNNIRQPSKLTNCGNYHMFKKNIRPSYEDPANSHGGKWSLFIKANNKELTIDMVWSSLVLALVGEQLDPENNVTGIVVSSRPRADRIQVWTRIKDDVDAVNAIGNRILEVIGFDPQDQQTMSLDFQVHPDAVLPANPAKYIRAGSYKRAASTVGLPSSGSNASRVLSPLTSASPVGSHITLPAWPPSPHSPLAPPSPRLTSGPLSSNRLRMGVGGNAFSGQIGTARRAFSTKIE